MSNTKIWEVTYIDPEYGNTVAEYCEGSTRMEARGHIVHRFKTQIDFISVVVVDDETEARLRGLEVTA